MKATLLIRADAGGATGTGHVMRMIALAQGYLRRGGRVVLASVNCPEKLAERVRSHNIEHYFINTKQPGHLNDAQLTTELAREVGAEWLVVDGYHFDYDYQKYVKQAGLSLLCVDDYGYSNRWFCDVILNQNLDADLNFEYVSDLEDTQVLAGGRFCLLREEFLKEKAHPRSWGKIECLLVTLGGSDSDNATETVLHLLNQFASRSLLIRVLVGADNPHVERLRSIKSHHHMEVVQNITNMPEQYAWADAIISAGGSTCWEWLYCGLPGAIVTIADNQLPIVRALTEQRKAALSLGWFHEIHVNSSSSKLKSWLEAPSSITDRNVACNLVDGIGVERVCQMLSDGFEVK